MTVKAFDSQQIATDFNKRLATGSTSITYKQQISTDFNEYLNLVLDPGVGGSNPLSSTIYFTDCKHFLLCHRLCIALNRPPHC